MTYLTVIRPNSFFVPVLVFFGFFGFFFVGMYFLLRPVYLVCLVCLVYPVQPNKPNKLYKPNKRIVLTPITTVALSSLLQNAALSMGT